MHEEKWDILNGTRTWGQAQGMTQHTGHGVKHKA